MPQSASNRRGTGILVLGFLLLVIFFSGKGQPSPAPDPKAPTSSGELSRSVPLPFPGIALPLLSALSSGTSSAELPDEARDLVCHHAYAGPLPVWECHHPDPATSLSPFYAPAALAESRIRYPAPETEMVRDALLCRTGSPTIASSEPPPRRAFSL